MRPIEGKSGGLHVLNTSGGRIGSYNHQLGTKPERPDDIQHSEDDDLAWLHFR